MSALTHIGISTKNPEESEAFYRALFGAAKVKRRPGYVRFEPEAPALVLSLVASPEADESPARARRGDHFGIRLATPEAVAAWARRMESAGLSVRWEREAACCYSVQDKVWVTDPDGNPWEVYAVTAEADVLTDESGDCCENRRTAHAGSAVGSGCG